METMHTEEPAPLLHVDSVQALKRPDPEASFTVSYAQYTLDDGSRYDVQEFFPRAPRYEIRATYTTPWCTDLEGFNKRVGASLADKGMNVVAVSPERLKTTALPRRLGSLTLRHDVQAHHAILNYLDSLEVSPSAPRQAVSVGYSRGAMIGFGLNAHSAEHGRDIRYSDYLDPCLEHRVRIRDVNWRDLPGYLGEELLALEQGLSQYPPAEQLSIMTGALKPSVTFWLQQAALAKTLFRGEAGTFVDNWHPDSVAHISLYTQSRFNHTNDWVRRFAQLPNVMIDVEPGVHLTGVDPKVLGHTVSRVVLAQELIKDRCTPAEMQAQIRTWQPPQPKPKPHRPALFHKLHAA